MLTFDEMKQSRLFQELAADYRREVRLEGEIKGKQETVLRLLKRRFKRISSESKAKINNLSASKLNDLIDSIFDFKSVADLTAWLKVHGVDR